MSVTVANTQANISGKTLVTAENSYTISGLMTFSRGASAPFAVVSGAANVSNLDADLVDGQHGAYYLAAANFTGSHTLPDSVLSTNVPLLNVANTFSATGTHIFGAGVAGSTFVQARNTTAGVANFAGFDLLNDEAVTSAGRVLITSSTYNTAFSNAFDPMNVASAMQVLSPRSGGLILNSENGPTSFYTNHAKRFGVDTSGNWLFGTSAHIMDSNGTPAIASGFGTGPAITGTDYGFIVTLGSTPGVTGAITFGHTFAAVPSITVSYANVASGPPGGQTVTIEVASTTGCTLRYAAGGAAITAGDKIHVQVRGF